ncbi:hypothetical protein GNI_141000 [Gregarina niphandrodes]|uniref:F-box domain-containing protein n=1 Tax=Gregarina niphandrodes TaxID=110365 RepID=A0A023B092_GRENI|nr:hypothetical protein GNI_141000 [Gregarina niphandrodes]EZG45065.1 hypothetical protein GNI_141000 [Gregarina niphandrodes]|eukprot:XP_011132569.1 hypothetical protein GNI_141000 [Gregarina niphandrodes]
MDVYEVRFLVLLKLPLADILKCSTLNLLWWRTVQSPQLWTELYIRDYIVRRESARSRRRWQEVNHPQNPLLYSRALCRRESSYPCAFSYVARLWLDHMEHPAQHIGTLSALAKLPDNARFCMGLQWASYLVYSTVVAVFQKLAVEHATTNPRTNATETVAAADLGRAVQTGAARSEAVQSEAARSEAAQSEAARSAAARSAAVQSEAVQSEAARSESGALKDTTRTVGGTSPLARGVTGTTLILSARFGSTEVSSAPFGSTQFGSAQFGNKSFQEGSSGSTAASDDEQHVCGIHCHLAYPDEENNPGMLLCPLTGMLINASQINESRKSFLVEYTTLL